MRHSNDLVLDLAAEAFHRSVVVSEVAVPDVTVHVRLRVECIAEARLAS